MTSIGTIWNGGEDMENQEIVRGNGDDAILKRR